MTNDNLMTNLNSSTRCSLCPLWLNDLSSYPQEDLVPIQVVKQQPHQEYSREREDQRADVRTEVTRKASDEGRGDFVESYDEIVSKIRNNRVHADDNKRESN